MDSKRWKGEGGGRAVLDRKLEMNSNVKHNTNLGVDQGFNLKLTKPWKPEKLLECYFVHKIRLSLKTEPFTRLKLIYLKKKNPNVFDSTWHHQGKKIPSNIRTCHILR